MNNIKTTDETYIAAKAILEGKTFAKMNEAESDGHIQNWHPLPIKR
jgi:hypothetical protein